MPLILIKPTLEERFCLCSYIQYSSTSSSYSSSSSPQLPAEEIQLVSYGLSDLLQQDIYEILMVWKKIKRVDFFLTVSIITPIKQGFTSQLAVFNYFFFTEKIWKLFKLSFAVFMSSWLKWDFFCCFFCHRLQRDFNLEKRKARTHSCSPSQPDRKLSSSSRRTHFNSSWTDTQWCGAGDKDIVLWGAFLWERVCKGDVILYSSRPDSLWTKL